MRKTKQCKPQSQSKKGTRQITYPNEEKKTRQGANPGNYDTLNPSWRFCKAASGHKWSINREDFKYFKSEMYSKMKEYESMTWQEIKNASKSHGEGSKSHNIPLCEFSKEVCNELKILNIIDIDELFSLRLDGKKRIYGILRSGILEIVWYDDKHEIYPVARN